MILNDATIRKLAEEEQLVVPYRADQQNPASYDVRLGRRIMEATPVGWRMHDLSVFTQDNPFGIEPGQFYLAETEETFNLPEDVAAQFVLKSSVARRGGNHLLAGFCDPGWHGSRLTMELTAVNPYCPLKVWGGMKVGQMVFHQTMPVEVSYAVTGRYNNDQSVQPAKREKDGQAEEVSDRTGAPLEEEEKPAAS